MFEKYDLSKMVDLITIFGFIGNLETDILPLGIGVISI